MKSELLDAEMTISARMAYAHSALSQTEDNWLDRASPVHQSDIQALLDGIAAVVVDLSKVIAAIGLLSLTSSPGKKQTLPFDDSPPKLTDL